MIYIYIYIYIYVYMYVYIYIYMYTCMYIYIYTYRTNKGIRDDYLGAEGYVDITVSRNNAWIHKWFMNYYIFVCIYEYFHDVYMYLYTFKCICICVQICT
jgi:hypothetical protein